MISLKHLASVIVAIMAEAMEESFSLDEFKASVLENAAALKGIINASKVIIFQSLTTNALMIWSMIRSHTFIFSAFVPTL